MKLAALSAAGLLLLLAVPAANAAPQYAGCATTSSGVLACGAVGEGVCGLGEGAGAAAGIVTWTLVVDTNHGDDAMGLRAPAAALAAAAPCWTDTCTTVSLYADGALVAQSQRLCM